MNRPVKRTLILGIETSCDETAAAVVENGTCILSNLISSQVEIHARFGGVVPEIASRRHLESINDLVDQALREAHTDLRELHAVAVSNGPGLVGALLIGVATAKALAYAARLPLVPVNHLEAHFYANFLTGIQPAYPLVALVVSGGHTELLLLPGPDKPLLLGRTRDDAAGEVFDKVARALGLGYPGGPVIDRLAVSGNPEAIAFPRAYLDEAGRYDFSFSGLKSAVINHLFQRKQKGDAVDIPDLAASFQSALVEVLVEKTIHACRDNRAAAVLMAGGVAANSLLRRRMLERLAHELPGVPLYYPPPELCTDNAAMIAAAAYPRYLSGRRASLDLNAVPGLSTDCFL
ncbi:MAG: tRNA (adenosine(37)-N6)-threonylcarbamoyltransferase complex transferase subunit TsaD [Bacillota bacterium]